MSLRIITEVLDRAPCKGNALVLLIALADQAGDTDRCAWPGIELLKHRGRCSRATAYRQMDTLVSMGVIERLEVGDTRVPARRQGSTTCWYIRPADMWPPRIDEGITPAVVTPRDPVDGLILRRSQNETVSECVLGGSQIEHSGVSLVRQEPVREPVREPEQHLGEGASPAQTPDLELIVDSPADGDGFEVFWRMWPVRYSNRVAARAGSKGSKQKARVRWTKLKVAERAAAAAAAQVYADWCTQQDRLPEDAVTWLNRRGWEDDYELVTAPEKPSETGRRNGAIFNLPDWTARESGGQGVREMPL